MEQLAKDFVSAAFDALWAMLGGLWDLMPWEVKLGGGVVLLIAVLFVVKLLKDLGGWPLVVAGLLGAVAFISGSVGFHKGRKWAEARKPTVNPKPKRRKTLL